MHRKKVQFCTKLVWQVSQESSCFQVQNIKDLLTFFLEVLICHPKHVHLNHKLIVKISLNLPCGPIFSYKLWFPARDMCFPKIKFPQIDGKSICFHFFARLITIFLKSLEWKQNPVWILCSWDQTLWHILHGHLNMHDQILSLVKILADFLVLLYVELSEVTLWKYSKS